MGREHRVEVRVRGTESAVQPATAEATTPVRFGQAFYLVGAPGTRKTEIAEAVAERFDNKLAFNDAPVTVGQYAVGSFADYRVELKLALNRVLEKPQTQPTIYTHSILDNLAYITSTIARYADHKAVTFDTLERSILTMTMIGTVVTDTFEYDHIFLLKGDFSPELDYEDFELQASLWMVLDQYELDYSVINVDENAANNVGDIVGEYLSG